MLNYSTKHRRLHELWVKKIFKFSFKKLICFRKLRYLSVEGKLLKNDIQNVISLMVDSQNTLSIPSQSTAPPSSIVDSNNTHHYTYSPNQSYHYHSMSSSNPI